MRKLNDGKLSTNFSFAGCGFLGIYHVGVGVCLSRYASHLAIQNFSGASAGALVACALLLELPLDELANEFFDIVTKARSESLGAFSLTCNVHNLLLDAVERHLPCDAHLTVSNRLHISLTRVKDGKNVIVSRFDSREDLIGAIACSMYIPGFSGFGLPPKLHGVHYMDGGMSDNLVALAGNTITVSPFYGKSDISPSPGHEIGYSFNFANTNMELSVENKKRLLRIILPLAPRQFAQLCQRGYNDALLFLRTNDLISCEECMNIPRDVFSEEIRKKCDECVEHSMPEYMGRYLAQLTKGPNRLMTTLFRIATLPMAIPCNIFNYFAKKLSPAAPRAASSRGCASRSTVSRHRQGCPRKEGC